MCVVQKYRFQYKYTRYQQDLIRMKELQEEYLFLNREGINGWEDVFREKHKAEHEISDIDAKKKELYNEHARCKYRYEKDGDAAVYLYHEAHYREQLAELKERRKEAKAKLGTINCCLKESTYAHLEIPDDVNIENLYLVDVPEFEEKEEKTVYDFVYESYEEEPLVETETFSGLYEAGTKTKAELYAVETEETMSDYDICEEESEFAPQHVEAVADVTVEGKAEPVSKEPVMTKEIYLSLTDKEKVEWLELADCDLQEAIVRFGEKMKEIGIVYKYSDDILDEFMKLESVAGQIKKEQEQKEEVQEEVRILDRNRGMSR